MINTFVSSFKINSVYKTNAFLYKIRKLWIVKKLIPVNIYQYTNVKLVINVILRILSYLFEFVKKIIYLLFFFLLPISLFGKEINQAEIFIHIFLFLNLLIGSFGQQVIMELSLEKYYCIKLMNMDAKKYVLTDFFFYLMKLFIAFLPPLIMMGAMCKVSWLNCLFLDILLITSRIVAEAFFIFVYNKKKQVLAKRGWYMGLIFGIGLLLGYGLPYFHLVIPVSTFSLCFITIAFLLLAIPAFLFLIKNDTYHMIFKKLLVRENVIFDTNEIVRKSQLETVKIDEKDIKIKDKVTKKTGFEYFNSVFFERHKRILMRSVAIMSIIMIVILVGATILVFFSPEIHKNVNRFLMTSLPYFVFIMYALNRGQVICKAMFFNCDHSMLTYQFYRTPKNTLNNFKVRLKMIVKLNLIPAIILAIGIVFLFFFTSNQNNWILYGSTFFFIIFMSIFFSVHHLVLYYLLQPYDINMDQKSSLYDLINGLTYFICYLCINMKLDTFYFSIGAIIVTFLYIVIALVFAYRLAPKRFKLK